jgi:tetratricopeptide (TPR) repeat protein
LVQEDATSDPKTRIRIGRLFVQAGSPARAAQVFRDILHDAPANGEAYAGLGEAEFARGNYRVAQRDFLAAVRWAPDDQAVRQRLDFSNELLRLDPTIRDLSAAERFRRSLKLVELTLDEIRSCIGPNPSQELRGLLDKVAKALAVHVGVAHKNEVSESNLDLAEQLWQARKKECKSPPDGNTPLALVLARLTQ